MTSTDSNTHPHQPLIRVFAAVGLHSYLRLMDIRKISKSPDQLTVSPRPICSRMTLCTFSQISVHTPLIYLLGINRKFLLFQGHIKIN